MIVVAGEALFDQLVRPDGTLLAVPGGGPFNVARTIARLGGEVAFLGALSMDAFGRRLRDALVADGVDLSMTMSTDAPTTLAIAELDAHGSARYRFHTAGTSVEDLGEDALAAALAARPAALHVGSLGLVIEPVASVLGAGVARADERTLVMLDPNCRPAAIADRRGYLARLDPVIARSDVVKASVDDLAYLRPGATPATAARELVERGPAVVVVTDGGRPVRVVTRGQAFEVPVPAVDVVDTVGAGDAFGGAFLARWIEHDWGRAGLAAPDRLREAVVFAIETAAETCRRSGAHATG
ncbi:MAG TPA: PfkB family carbohydrate kinase [Candidatus Limnocylindrales bacterium]|nr:PfkB family carbohydrate kinase [Candidatus Limnocylindrales bacterium]